MTTPDPHDPLYSPEDVRAARRMSYTGKAVAALLLGFLLWVPGLIATVMFYNEARRTESIAGQSLPRRRLPQHHVLALPGRAGPNRSHRRCSRGDRVDMPARHGIRAPGSHGLPRSPASTERCLSWV